MSIHKQGKITIGQTTTLPLIPYLTREGRSKRGMLLSFPREVERDWTLFLAFMQKSRFYDIIYIEKRR